MAIAALYLADKSALARLVHPPVARRLGPLLVDGLVATSPIIDLEVLYSARSLTDYEDILAERRSLPSYPLTEEVTDRAIAVQHRLAQTRPAPDGNTRSPHHRGGGNQRPRGHALRRRL